MTLVLAVGGTDQYQITERQDFTVASFMWEDTQRGHVELPNNVCGSVVFENLFSIWSIVLTVAETLCVEATKLTFGGDVVQPVAFNIRNARRRRQQPVS